MTGPPTAGQRLVLETVGRFCTAVVEPRVTELEHASDARVASELASAMGNLGLFGPLGSGGDDDAESDDRTAGLVLERLAKSAAGLALVLLVDRLARTIGREAPLASVAATDGAEPDRPLAFPAYAEPTGDEHPTFVREGAGVVIRGTSRFVPNAPIARVLVLPVVGRADGRPGLVALRADAPGVRVGAPLTTLGARGCPTADVELDDAWVPDRDALTQDTLAEEVLVWSYQRHRSGVAAALAGIVSGSIRTAVDHAHARHQGGAAIVEHAQVRAILAGMVADHATLIIAAHPRGLGLAAATSAFLRAREAAVRATSDGIQLLGGSGYMEDFPQERRFRDSRQLASLLGRGDCERQRLAAAWLAEDAPLPECTGTSPRP